MELPDGTTAVIEAAISNKLKMVQLLVKNKANVNHLMKNGRTPLTYAIIFGRLKLFELLLHSGSDYHSELERYKRIFSVDPTKINLWVVSRTLTVEDAIKKINDSEFVLVDSCYENDEAPVLVGNERQSDDEAPVLVRNEGQSDDEAPVLVRNEGQPDKEDADYAFV
jgi:ankyrin repeat protein